MPLLVPQMSEWIAHSKELFVQSLQDVGLNHQHALDLHSQHQHFTANCMVLRTHTPDTGAYIHIYLDMYHNSKLVAFRR